MRTTHLFKEAIAKPLSELCHINKNNIVNAISQSRVSGHSQFSLAIPKIIPHSVDVTAFSNEIANKFKPNDMIQGVSVRGPALYFDVQPTAYIQSTLRQVYSEKDRYGHQKVPLSDQKTVLLDYSSPNIAKPFHAGHLRSTILGNFIKRIHEANGYRAIGINYLGDWGKQYGLLAVGFEIYGDDNKLKEDPIHHLYDVYVQVNKLAADNPDIDMKANEYFKRMEEGDPRTLSQWRRFRELSIESYKRIYKRLGIRFDEYSGESATEPYINKVYDLLKQHQLFDVTEDGAWVVDLDRFNLGKPIVRRKDGTSLYLTRDLANIMLRQHKYSFDKSIYVVGSEQEQYMKQIFKISELIHERDPSWPHQFYHANFGRIKGMSTRKGTVVFLQDILDTASETMKEIMKAGNQLKLNELEIVVDDRVLKGEEAVNVVADRLGVSAVLIQDMAPKRIKNYDFSWKRMTDNRGATGIYLQYTYARLCGIERKANTPIHDGCDLSLLKEREALELAVAISHFPDVVEAACQSLDPCTIVQYLFKLTKLASTANAVLQVKGTDPSIAEARMLLFWAARSTLGNGLKLLGITPLDRI
ncbi:arginyl-tRNA synthetase [Pilobolus umbonatus]|nr:arginyl-tRNA synthetase [Pilobolus umbonatus]